jgi:hypothetical protein
VPHPAPASDRNPRGKQKKQKNKNNEKFGRRRFFLLRRICRKSEGGAGGTSESFAADSYSFEEESKLSNEDCSSPSGIPSVGGVLIAYH